MKIYNLKDKIKYLDEVVNLEYEEWANNKEENKKDRIKAKKRKFLIHLIISLFAS